MKPTVIVKPLVDNVLDDQGFLITGELEVIDTTRIRRRIQDGELEVVTPTEPEEIESPKKATSKPKQEV
jgi:hypothetical protein